MKACIKEKVEMVVEEAYGDTEMLIGKGVGRG